MFHLSDIGGLSSTIVETVSIEVEDFNDSFLTCGTCLCVYDAGTHAPKLLPCSHTICLCCARRIVELVTARNDDVPPTCPVCRASFPVPPAGVASLPASFVVNQLLDLMAAGRRRDVIPKCTQHLSTELLFCETCDMVFCPECDTSGSGSHSAAGATASAAHTVVPFAVAIRRVSEILQYKAAQCSRNLDNAAESIEQEMQRLDDLAERCIESVSRSFAELSLAVERRKQDVLSTVRNVCEEKSRILQEQLQIMDVERDRIRVECNGLPADVRGITARIGKLHELLDASSSLAEPRENAYIAFNDLGLSDLQNSIGNFGAIRTSSTFPALCTVTMPTPTPSIHVRSRVVLRTIDQDGVNRTTGGDPVSADLKSDSNAAVPVAVRCNGDGTYNLDFLPTSPGRHYLTVRIFDRAVRAASPLVFDVNPFHDPIATYADLHQPVAVALDGAMLYILDTGNSRVAVFDTEASVGSSPAAVRYITGDAVMQRGATGMSLVSSSSSTTSLFITNWRTRYVTELSTRGDPIRSFSCDSFVEPTSVAVGRDWSIFVADNAARCIFVFSPSGNLRRSFGTRGQQPGQLDLVTCLYTSPFADELLVCDHRVQAFSYSGDFLYSLPPGDAIGRGQYGGIVVDVGGRYLASRSERGRAVIQVFDSARRWLFSICSGPAARMRRPSGLVVDNIGHVFVADLGNDCVRKLRYL